MIHFDVSFAVVSVPCSLVVTSWERAGLLAVMFVVFWQYPKCVLVHIRIKGEMGAVKLVEAPQYNILTDRSKAVLLLWIIYFLFMCCVCRGLASVYCYLVVHLLGKD